MKKKLSMGKFKLIAVTLCLITVLLSVVLINASAADSEYRTFTAADVSDPLYVKKHFTEMPRALVAEINIPETLGRAAPIIANYPGSSPHNLFGLEISKTTGYPLFYYNSNDNSTKTSITFKYDVRGKGNITIAVANEIVDGNSVYKLYVDGVLVATDTSKPKVHDFDIENAQLNVREFSIGADGKNYNEGSIRSLQVYSKAPTYTEGYGITFEDGTLMASYGDMTANDDIIKDASGNGHDAIRNSVLLQHIEGRSFSYSNVANPIVPDNYIEKMPRGFEAEIYMPTGQSIAAPIFSSYNNNGEGSWVGFEITASGNPKVFYQDYVNKNDHSVSSITFSDYDVRGKGMVKLAVVCEAADGNGVYKLYVNGEHIQTVNSTYEDFDILRAQNVTREFTLGYDGKNYFQGKIKNVAVYSRAITAEEAKSSYENGVNLSLDALIAYYDLTNKNNSDVFVSDESKNGYDLTPVFYERKNPLKDYAYSFAFVGDTQFLVEQDIQKGYKPKYTKPIYDWILANKEKKNIQYVFGLGDVTQSNLETEWQYALELHQELGKELPYAIVAGNHDTVPKFDQAFANEPTLNDNISGYYKSGSVGNYYSNFEVMGHKYMVVALEYGADDATLDWANGVVSQYPDRQVIVITHCYMEYDGNRTVAGGTGSLTTNTNTGYVYNNGEDIWNDFASLHENVIMVVAGHIEPMVIQQRHDEAKNGNIVHQFLIDPQGIDKATRYETGMVAMFYFSEDGSDVQVEYISTYKTLENQKIYPNADDVLFREINQFEFEIEPLDVEGVDTPYGLIPADKADATENPIAVFNNGKFVGTYKYFSRKNSEGDSALKAAYTKLIGGTYASKGEGTVVILLRDNVTAPQIFENMGQIIGNVIIDLNGYTITQTYQNNPLFYTQAKYYKKMGDATYDIKNGNLLITRTLFTMEASGQDYANNATDTSFKTFTMNFHNVNIGYKQDAKTDAANFLGYFGENLANGKKVVYDIEFNECVFDLTYYNFPSGAAFLNANDTNTSKTNAIVNVDVNGGELILAKSGIIFSSVNSENGSSVAFGKTEGGNYTAITVPKGTALPTASVNGGELVFVKVSESVADGTETHRLRLAELSGINYSIKTSITLDSQLVINAYVPVESTVKFTFGGVSYENLSNIESKIVTLNDGKKYYHVSISLPSAKAAENVKLVATVSQNNKSATVTFTLSIQKYAEKVLKNEASTNVEKTLVKDVLAYVQAAYNYFTDFNTTERIASVNAVVNRLLAVGGDYNGDPSYENVGEAQAELISKAELVLDEKPTVRFYVVNNAQIDFYIPNAQKPLELDKLNTKTVKDANGNIIYVELDVYAYALSELITYKLGDIEGTYCLYDYLYQTEADEDLMAQDNADALLGLIISFIKYTESAADYRKSVIGADN